MKNFIILLLLAISFSVFGQTTNVATGGLQFAETIHDYGRIKKGADGNCTFKFTNISKEAIVISNVRASCGCTTPSWPQTPIEPGKSGEIVVHYNTNLQGAFAKTISVYIPNQTITLSIKGEVLNE